MDAGRRENGEARYLAVIGDLRASRQRADRGALQEALERTLHELGRERPRAVAAAPSLTAGDEVQCLLREPAAAMWFVQELTDRLHGMPRERGSEPAIAFGLGWGPLSAGEIPPSPEAHERVWMLDGPCFHHARAALEATRAADAWVLCKGLSEQDDEVVSALCQLMWTIRSGWTAVQSETTYQRRRQETQRDVAKLRAMSPSAVSQHLKAAHFPVVVAGERAVERVLASYSRQWPARAEES